MNERHTFRKSFLEILFTTVSRQFAEFSKKAIILTITYFNFLARFRNELYFGQITKSKWVKKKKMQPVQIHNFFGKVKQLFARITIVFDDLGIAMVRAVFTLHI